MIALNDGIVIASPSLTPTRLLDAEQVASLRTCSYEVCAFLGIDFPDWMPGVTAEDWRRREILCASIALARVPRADVARLCALITRPTEGRHEVGPFVVEWIFCRDVRAAAAAVREGCRHWRISGGWNHVCRSSTWGEGGSPEITQYEKCQHGCTERVFFAGNTLVCDREWWIQEDEYERTRGVLRPTTGHVAILRGGVGA